MCALCVSVLCQGGGLITKNKLRNILQKGLLVLRSEPETLNLPHPLTASLLPHPSFPSPLFAPPPTHIVFRTFPQSCSARSVFRTCSARSEPALRSMPTKVHTVHILVCGNGMR